MDNPTNGKIMTKPLKKFYIKLLIKKQSIKKTFRRECHMLNGRVTKGTHKNSVFRRIKLTQLKE